MTPDLDALRAAMVDAILDTPMQPVKPTTGQLVDAILAHPKVAALLAEDARSDPLDWSPLLDITHEEDGSWSVSVKAMRGHVGAADTLQQAIVEAADAAEAWVGAAYDRMPDMQDEPPPYDRSAEG